MKYVVLSFDDGRADFFSNVFPILKKYKLPATLNVITDYVDNSQSAQISSTFGSISWEELKICRENGIEIANHSANHTNHIQEIIRGANRLRDCLEFDKAYGFASPHSEIWEGNLEKYLPLMDDGTIRYICSGNQRCRDGLLRVLLFCLSKFTKWSWVFYLYNRKNIIQHKITDRNFLFPRVTCNKDNSMEQLISFLKRMPDNTACIIMLHSVFRKDDPKHQTGKWSNTITEFDELCSFLTTNPKIKVLTNEKLFYYLTQT